MCVCVCVYMHVRVCVCVCVCEWINTKSGQVLTGGCTVSLEDHGHCGFSVLPLER